MIQDIFPHKFNNDYLPIKKIRETDYILHYKDNSILLKTCKNGFELPKKNDFSEFSDSNSLFLFRLNDVPCFLIHELPKEFKEELVYTDISFFRTAEQQEIAWVGIAGLHLRNWYLLNAYCGTCGSKTKHKHDERALFCPDCNAVIYPKISPAIIVAIVCKNRILLARNTNFKSGMFSLIAGYSDIGESLEETVIREVKEEVGLDVKNIRYYKSQPWPLSGSMMIGFVAEADDKQSIVTDDKEIAEAAWFERGDLPVYSPNLSIAGEMIETFDRGEL